ncbi:hypoxia-inducible factor 1-alpha-like isoform X3 [Heterodontus francisci]|uniref:hypoxia-inducible factor 1-alpha-like isoform X3 n=1 Tax=Heterodontus francisci TaxID=7792 RepID=UPI00355B1E25
MAAEVRAPPFRAADQRKERSRDAARSRRGKETEVLYELGQQLPLPRSVISHLDKASIMRVTISYLRLRRVLEAEPEKPARAGLDVQLDRFYLRALEGFVMVLTEEGDIVYLSENVNRYLGLTQLDLIGHSVFEFVHPCDEEELKDLVTSQHGLPVKQEVHLERDFFMRMKSTLTSKGRTVAIKSATWKVLHCTGHMKSCEVSSKLPNCGFPERPMSFLVMICEPIPHPSSIEIVLDSKTFLSRHSMDMKFTYCDQKITELIGYHPKVMLGHTSYKFYHSLDSDHMTKTHRILLSKGQVTSGQYRFLAKNGGYVWLRTQATAIYNSKNSWPQCIVCINFVLSAVIEDTVDLALEQTQSLQEPATDPKKDQDPFTQCNENLEKLDELAPTPGDVIVPLDFTDRLDSKAFHFTRTLPDDSPGSLLPEEFCTPELCKLLSPIFNHPEEMRSNDDRREEPGPLNKAHELQSEEATTSEAAVPNPESYISSGAGSAELDLEMLAPYISMEEDFQLSSYESPEEKDGQVCSDEKQDTDPNNQPTTCDDACSLSETLIDTEAADTANICPRSSSFHTAYLSEPDSTESQTRCGSLRDILHPPGGPAAMQRSNSMTDLSETPALSLGNKSIAFGGPAFTVAVENVLLALFQPQTAVNPPETGVQISQSASSNGQDAASLKALMGLKPSDQLDTAGTESATPAEPSQHSPSKQRPLDVWAGKDQEEFGPLRNLKRKHSLQNGNLQDSVVDVSSVADIVRVTAKRLKKIESSKTGLETESLALTSPMTLTMQLLGTEISGPPELTRYDGQVNAPLPGKHHLLQGVELLKALDQVS